MNQLDPDLHRLFSVERAERLHAEHLAVAGRHHGRVRPERRRARRSWSWAALRRFTSRCFAGRVSSPAGARAGGLFIAARRSVRRRSAPKPHEPRERAT
jgi:hypothetical protein